MVGAPLSNPEATLATANFWIEVCTALVAAGVVLELFDLLIFSKDMSGWQRRLLFVASFMVVIGCGGEFVFEKQAMDAETKLQRQSDDTVAKLQAAEASDSKIATQAAAKAAGLGVTVGTLGTTVTRETTRANALAAEARAQQRETSATVAELNQRRAELDRARTDAQAAAKQAANELSGLEARVKAREPRTLTDDQRQQLVNWLSPPSIPKPKVLINWLMTDPEAMNLAKKVEGALKQAGYTVEEADFGQQILGTNATGIVVEVKDLSKQPRGGGAIFKALSSLGFAISSEEDSTVPDADTVEIFFSARP